MTPGQRLRLPVFLILAAVPALAQAPAGPEFKVNGVDALSQAFPVAAADARGNIVVVWRSENGQDGDGFGLFGQRFDAAGRRLGAEFLVNTYTTANESAPAVAADAAGNFVVVWMRVRQYLDGDGVFARRFDAAGRPRGEEFQVSGPPAVFPVVAADAAGDFVVAWTTDTGFGSEGDVFARRYDSTGAPRGAAFRVNSYTTLTQRGAAVAVDPAGAFVVSWESFPTDGSRGEVRAQRYAPDGVPRAGEFRVNSYTTGGAGGPSVACDAAGNFVVAWWSSGRDGSYGGSFAQRFDAGGSRLGLEFQLNTYTTSDQGSPLMASDAIGNFVVSWQSERQDGSYSGVYAQRFDASGARRGAEFRVNTTTFGSQLFGTVASDDVGNFLIGWTGFDVQADVFGQRYGGLRPLALEVDVTASGSRARAPP